MLELGKLAPFFEDNYFKWISNLPSQQSSLHSLIQITATDRVTVPCDSPSPPYSIMISHFLSRLVASCLVWSKCPAPKQTPGESGIFTSSRRRRRRRRSPSASSSLNESKNWGLPISFSGSRLCRCSALDSMTLLSVVVCCSTLTTFFVCTSLIRRAPRR